MNQHQITLTYGPQPAPAAGGGSFQHASEDMETSPLNSITVSLPDCGVGGSIVASVYWYDASDAITISSITCSGESNFTVQGSPVVDTGSAHNRIQIATLANLTAGGTKTITVNFSGNLTDYDAHIKVTHFPGTMVDSTDLVEAIGTAFGPNDITGQTTASASATSTEANSVLYFTAGTTFYPSPAGNHFSPASGLTELSESTPDFYQYGGAWAGYLNGAGTAGTETGSCTFGDADNWTAILLIMNPP